MVEPHLLTTIVGAMIESSIGSCVGVLATLGLVLKTIGRGPGAGS